MQKYRVEVKNDGNVYWYKFGTNVLHRENGPAIEWVDVSKEYWINGKRHREDGPAIEYANGHKVYFINGKAYSFTEWQKKVKELQSTTCEGKVVEIEGKKYKLTEIK